MIGSNGAEDQAGKDDGIAGQLSVLEHALLDPGVRADPSRVAALLSEDFLEFGNSGRIWTKATTLAALAAERPPSSLVQTVSDFAVRRLAEDVALVTYATVRKAPKGPDARTLRSSVWTRSGGKWRMSFHQGTPAAASD